MLQIKRVMEEQAKESLVKMILEQARSGKMTILNVEEVMTQVINHLKANAVLEMEDSDNSKPSIS